MIDSALLLKDLKAQLKLLQADLRVRAEDTGDEWGARLRQEWAEARRRERTGHPWITWRDNEVDQAAVAWIVATVFLRFCEDNDLLAGAQLDGRPVPIGWIAGPGERTARAEENLTAYFQANSLHNRRHWLQQGIRVLAAQPAGKALVDPEHNPVWTALISPESATALIAFWRRTDASGALVHDFTDRDLGTRFLGDLYQDLSEHAKKTYALLQTPVFVEEFILDQTLTPALKEFGHEGLKLIDPTCGSGHFLLSAFDRLLARWTDEAPAMNVNERVRRAMNSIHGVDLNPFAVAIARFRLTVAGLKAMGEQSLVGVEPLGYHLAIGDALLGESGGVPAQLPFEEGEYAETKATYLYDTEDLKEYSGILQPGQYHMVVGNPPYVAVSDKTLKGRYRELYSTSHGQYALSVPFMELFFRLAITGAQGQGAGYVGQITANSFMKREFGKKLIENLFGGFILDNPVDLQIVVDTSGAFIPGHGTPTVIVVGRRRRPVGERVRAVLGVSGEPGQPADPAKGLVWSEIVAHFEQPGYTGRYISVTDADRATLGRHPWSLSGGGAAELKTFLELETRRLNECVRRMGMFGDSHAEDYFAGPTGTFKRLGVNAVDVAGAIDGNVTRDWDAGTIGELFYAGGPVNNVHASAATRRAMWRWRTSLWDRATFSGPSYRERGIDWLAWHQVSVHSVKTTRLTFAKIATHYHGALTSRAEIEKPGALRIELPEGATEGQHLELLGALNSSTACFWLKQVSHNKGRPSADGAGADEPWEHRYEFTGTKLEQFPLAAELPLNRGRALDSLARELDAVTPRAVVTAYMAEPVGGLGQRLKEAEAAATRLRERMIFEQEELDWEVYRLYGLADGATTQYDGAAPSDLCSSSRAFAIALAREVEANTVETSWFDHWNHRYPRITALPADWPADYAALVQRRLDLIESDPNIRLLEKPEFKRRWAATPWVDQLTAALKAAILDRLEQPELWRDEQGPITRSVAELADLLRADAILRELAAVLTGTAEPDLAALLGSLATEEAVPYLAAHRYTATGLEKYRTWQEVWALQRREDAGKQVEIDVPPKYNDKDFRRKEFWRARGKLDVPKERFVLYPGVRREGDPTPVLGWAGWDHRAQALALGRELPNQDALGAGDDALVPLVAGLVELEPWLHQWHHEVDPAFGISPAAAISGLVDQYLQRMETTRDRVTAWTPPAPVRGRRPKRP